ncbi:protein WHAT'S THIS FACTOR 9, mitochondrial-like [Nicotiana tabacum]|uniref:Protein ROOT PRIMORDIUM DEFECTIVE 1-like isoform X1 n=1 Tax=Nicotiana tabacum TaxID=4097 RepID=A0A1S4AY55_TOBAC|nr:PREDICTED: protein ROOT PRIMORDIUM DEFECTIVE 1-like isoform X1 [Nicotiana tabacum]
MLMSLASSIFLQNWPLYTNLTAMIRFIATTTTVIHHHLRQQIRTFVNARIKWVRDPYLDKAVEKEKNLKPLLSLKNLILSHPSKSLPLRTISPLKPQLNLPTTALKFIQNYPFVFKTFRPPVPLSTLHVKLTPNALSLHNDETLFLSLSHYRKDLAQILAKLLMLTRAKRLPFYVIERFKFDLGLPRDYLLSFLPEFPEYFQICQMGFKDSDGREVFGLELVKWREDLAVSVMEKRVKSEDLGGRKRVHIRFSMNLPRGFDLVKKVRNWVEEWQNLPYISPYEDAFHLAPNSDQAEKWTVGVIHELLSLLVSKKTERENIYCLGDYLGFGIRFRKALVHHPGIFYLSNKIRTHTIVLREGFNKNILVEKHPLMRMRYKYISLMNRVLRRGIPINAGAVRYRKRLTSSLKGGKRKENEKRMRQVKSLET